MKLSKKECFQAKIIKDYFSKKYSTVEYCEGEDPPDIYLKYDPNKSGIELTELNWNLYKDRVSVNMAYKGFIKDINIEIPNYTHYLVVFHHANIKLNKKRKKDIKNFLRKPNPEMEKCINGIFVKIKPTKSEKETGTISQTSINMDSCSRDINTVSASLMDFNIENVFESIINMAIEMKKEKCKSVDKPIWLAMHDSNFSRIFSQSTDDSVELYNKAMKNIDFGIFEKIIITFGDRGIIIFNR